MLDIFLYSRLTLHQAACIHLRERNMKVYASALGVHKQRACSSCLPPETYKKKITAEEIHSTSKNYVHTCIRAEHTKSLQRRSPSNKTEDKCLQIHLVRLAPSTATFKQHQLHSSTVMPAPAPTRHQSQPKKISQRKT